MKEYRIWVKDITLQSLVVEAESEREAERIAAGQLDENGVGFEEMDETVWEVTSVEEITH